jgi:hypothetical protein
MKPLLREEKGVNSIMDSKKPNNKKRLTVRIDNSLAKLKDQPYFQEKLDKANDTLAQVGLPKERRRG